MLTNQITSLQHPIVKHLVTLRKNASARSEAQEVLVVGKKLIYELAEHFSFKKVLFSDDSLLTTHLRSEEFFQVTDGILKKITALASPDGIAATLNLPEEQDLSDKSHILVLDRIADPGNLGTLFRTGRALGWEGVYLLPETVDLFNEKVIRSAKGANFHLPYSKISYDQLLEWMKDQKNHFYIADMHGEKHLSVKPKLPAFLILSSESHGCRPELKKYSTSIQIPMFHNTESLNVAVAGGILMQHLRGSHA